MPLRRLHRHWHIIFCLGLRRRFKVRLVAPAVIEKLFENYSENGIMSVDQLRRFLVEVQQEVEVTHDYAQSIASSFKQFRLAGLNLEAFFNYLLSDLNHPLSPEVHHDMTAPLSDYFIYTSHNSYLTKNGIAGDCSDVPIVHALKNGVRVIELDIWPNAFGDDVEVRHGRTFTTAVELIKCLRSIREYAFVASPYPVIIALEDHLDPHLQAKVAKMLRETFGEMLFSPDSLVCLEELCVYPGINKLPSPEWLKFKILITTKPSKEYLECKVDNHEGKKPWQGITQSDEEDKSNDDEEDSDDADKPRDVAPEFNNLVIVHAEKPKGGLDNFQWDDSDKVRHVSFREPSSIKAVEPHREKIVRFTQRNFVKVYPKDVGINYNPMIWWMHGVQMVAHNMQDHEKNLRLMQEMFKANGGCGYVKKPAIVMDRVFNPGVRLSVKKTLKVALYIGKGWDLDFVYNHFDYFSPPDFYTHVEIFGTPTDCVVKKTKVIEDDWVPNWNEEFTFPLTVPELALLRIKVNSYDMSENTEFAGQTCLPILGLKAGFRAVPLYSKEGERYNTVKLLMRFNFIEE